MRSGAIITDRQTFDKIQHYTRIHKYVNNNIFS